MDPAILQQTLEPYFQKKAEESALIRIAVQAYLAGKSPIDAIKKENKGNGRELSAYEIGGILIKAGLELE